MPIFDARFLHEAKETSPYFIKTGPEPYPNFLLDRRDTFEHVEKGKPMRDSDMKQLEKLLMFKEYAIQWELIEEMLKYGKTIEQEAVVL
ncbi:hypothetical protein [Oceanobacillus damuensis]|uniref:hypothetical protein n=1 Tax=Oceanobacillus damuensis TaxID=937928 RepID=UPI00082EDEC4|nr:hypothetical protein [Oceanobacillus damuensis]